jgi:hypothetical protein
MDGGRLGRATATDFTANALVLEETMREGAVGGGAVWTAGSKLLAASPPAAEGGAGGGRGGGSVETGRKLLSAGGVGALKTTHVASRAKATKWRRIAATK